MDTNKITVTKNFETWLCSLTDSRAAARIKMRIDRAKDGNFGDCGPVGDGISEMKIHYGPGYRVYFCRRGQAVYVLLAGGDKSTQDADIKLAKELAKFI